MSIRLLITDDHAQVRTTLKMALSLWGDFTIIGEASNGVEAVELSKILQPDVVLMDLDMPHMDGVEATNILHEENPSIHILILTASVEFDRVKAALSAGAEDYVLKTAPIDEIGNTIRTVANYSA